MAVGDMGGVSTGPSQHLHFNTSNILIYAK